jgi:hypothetical protein
MKRSFLYSYILTLTFCVYDPRDRRYGQLYILVGCISNYDSSEDVSWIVNSLDFIGRNG